MGVKLLCLFLTSILVAYYIYSPMPEDFDEPWKVMLIAATFRTVGHLAEAAEQLGLMHYMETLMLISAFEYVEPTSNENVTVTDTEFNNVSVRLYLPKKESDGLRRAVVFFHGGGWCLGDAGMKGYDHMMKLITNLLNAVVVSANYRLAPKHRFPAQFEDVYSVTKFFLQSKVLSQYGVDPARVAVAGDSAGGNLAAAVAQQLLEDPEVENKLKVQALLYPVLQCLDLNLPSYQENINKPLLTKSLMIRFCAEYFTSDPSLREAMASGRHVPLESSHLFQLVNWSALLPEEMKKGHVYSSPVAGSSELARKYPGFLDRRAAPLLASDAQLRGLPRTYILTCRHDVLRDDGVMYARRLQAAAVPVTHHHAKDAFHGALMFVETPAYLTVADRLCNGFLEWLDENL
ncbi:arylacetamide deacetylase [Colius striatus]|uniref:arylacetamide deacetylase n=1 Tax=Colius striatus TaxID=57412 RepID=UPI002B1E4537|nr:arylacetamide deacetylase [Colius striatus]XP_061861800.1 arylacetamide deacetylase [Colius striatus]